MRFRRHSEEADRFVERLRQAYRRGPAPNVDIDAALADIHRRVRAGERPHRERRVVRRAVWIGCAAAGGLLVLGVCIAFRALADQRGAPAQAAVATAPKPSSWAELPMREDRSSPGGATDGRSKPLVTLPVTPNTTIQPSTGPVRIGGRHFTHGWRVDVGANALGTGGGLSFSYRLPPDGLSVRFDTVVGATETSSACRWSLSTDGVPKTGSSKIVHTTVWPGQASPVRLPLTEATAVKVSVLPVAPQKGLTCVMGDPHIVLSSSAPTPPDGSGRGDADPAATAPVHPAPPATHAPCVLPDGRASGVPPRPARTPRAPSAVSVPPGAQNHHEGESC